MHYGQNTRGQIAMVWSCDTKRGLKVQKKMNEKNHDSRGQRTPQSRTTEEAMGRHRTARHEVSPIKERAHWRSKEVERKDPSVRPFPWEELIQAGRRYIYDQEWKHNHIFSFV